MSNHPYKDRPVGSSSAKGDSMTAERENLSSVSCGNEKHPDGAWHPSTPLPGPLEWRKHFNFWLNRKQWGCGCDRVGEKGMRS
jgi:hypothetical protein